MLGHHLARLKEKSGLTCQQIADKSGVPLSTVSRLVSGQTENPSYRHVADVVIAMGGSLDAIEGIERPQEKTPDKVLELYERALARKNKYIIMLITLCLILVAILVALAGFDVLHGGLGYIQY